VERLGVVPDHANDNEPSTEKKRILKLLKQVSDAEEGRRILAQFSRLIDGEIVEP
jgi:hypothetical protein